MKKSLRILMVVLALALAVSMFGIAGAETEATATTQAQLYIGEYDADMTGLAHIVFGQVSDTTAEYGIILRSVPATEGEEVVEKVFEGKNIGAEGKFGIAVYGLPEGAYWAMAYTGAGEDRVIGNATYFQKGVAEYNVTYNLDGGESAELEAGDTFAQGTRPEAPAEVPVKEGWEFLGWNYDTWSSTLFDFDAEGAVNGDITLNAIYAPKADETYRITLDHNVSGQYTTLTSAINPVLAEGEQVILTFDINKIYSNVTRVTFATQDIAHSRNGNWWAYNGVDTEYAHSSYLYATASVFDNYSGMIAGDGKVNYDANGLVNGEEHWTADDGWYLTGGSGIPNDPARYGSIPFGEGKTVKLVYTAPSADAKASLCVYTKASVDGDSTFVLNSAIMNIPDFRADLTRTVQIMLDTNCCLDMNVSNLSCTTSGGQNLGVQTIITKEGNVGSIVPEEFEIVNPNVLVYDIEVTNNASTTGFGGADVLAVPYGGSLVYEFDIVESNLDVQDVLGIGDVYDKTTNATMGWFGIGLRHSGGVSNWPWKMMYTNGSYSGISNNGIGGTAEYPMFEDSANSHWCKLMETGASVKVVYTRATAGNSDGSFIVYKKAAGETEYAVFAQNTGLGDITGNAAINFMWWDAGPRVLKVTNIYSYVLDANGVKGASASPFGVCSLTKFVEVE